MNLSVAGHKLRMFRKFLVSKHRLALARKLLAERGFAACAIRPSIEALMRSRALQVVNTECGTDLYLSTSRLSNHARTLENIDPESSCSVRLIAEICQMAMDPAVIPNPFKPHIVHTSGACSFNTRNLSEYDLKYLAETYSLFSSSLIKSRIADVVWSCSNKKDAVIAKQAVKEYLSISIDSDDWHHNKDTLIRRGLVLAKLVKEKDLVTEFEQLLVDKFNLWANDWEYAHLGLFDIVLEFQLCKTHYPIIGKTCADMGRHYLSQNRYEHACDAYELAASFIRKHDQSLHYDYLKYRADCMRAAAVRYMFINKQYPAAEKHYTLATNYYRNIPKNERHSRGVDRILQELPFQQRLAGKKLARQIGWVNSIREADYLIKMPEVEERYRSLYARQETPSQVICLTASLFMFPNYEILKDNTERSMENHFFSRLMGTARYSSDGRQEAQINSPGLSFDNEDDVVTNVNQNISQNHRLYVQNLLVAKILPGLESVATSINIKEQDIFDLCRTSVVLRSDRKKNAALAVYYGLQLRFSESLHLSVPLIENIVRDVLRSQGKETSKISESGVQIEIGLSGLIRGGEMESIFGKDVTFSIWSYFANHLGPNLRNNVAHGLVSDMGTKNLDSVYVWWFLVWLLFAYHPPYNYAEFIQD